MVWVRQGHTTRAACLLKPEGVWKWISGSEKSVRASPVLVWKGTCVCSGGVVVWLVVSRALCGHGQLLFLLSGRWWEGWRPGGSVKATPTPATSVRKHSVGPKATRPGALASASVRLWGWVGLGWLLLLTQTPMEQKRMRLSDGFPSFFPPTSTYPPTHPPPHAQAAAAAAAGAARGGGGWWFVLCFAWW